MQMIYKLLLNKNVQRLFFSLGIIVWWGLWYNRVFKYGGGISSFGISYELLLWLPTIVLLIHIIFLNFYSWVTTSIILLLIVLRVVMNLYNDYLIYHGSAVKNYMNNSSTFIEIGVFIFCVLFIGFVIWKMRPTKYS